MDAHTLEMKLEGEIEITSGKLVVLAPGDGKLFWFRPFKDLIKLGSHPHVVEYRDMVLADMLTRSYAPFKALKSGSFITIERAPMKETPTASIIAFDSILACCDQHKIPWDLTGDRPYTTDLDNGLYKIKFIEGNVLAISPKR